MVIRHRIVLVIIFICKNIEQLCGTPETHIILQISSMSIKIKSSFKNYHYNLLPKMITI